MPRSPRIEVAGGIHHVTSRGNRRERIFRDDRDRVALLRRLAIVTREYRWRCLSYCLMDNHVHFVIETPETTLGLGMRQLFGRYVQAFNERHELPGRMFQARYGSVLVRTDRQFAQLLRYVALNPVVAGLCVDPCEWPWSSHRALLARVDGRTQSPTRVESLLEIWGGEAGSRYARLFDVDHPVAVEFGADSPWTHRPPLEQLLGGEGLDDGMRAARDHGYRLAEIAEKVGLHVSTVSRRTRRAK